ncbi:dnd system-associated protein 3 [Rhodopirellula baltica WH47]|uniref:Dnd system-associated protein 3 n=2 Tax=Rhodopirellula baltica TaxID=265606 RepID=F2AZG8_RHOBT|nr:dnd system-associated protein 3 [Rhodopirellula baltica WH47]
MSLKQTIEMLSKGSAQAVTTLNSKSKDAEKLKSYLYVQTPVEKALLLALGESFEKRIIFLCGSSGDGKSEIFRRIHKRYSESFDFHLDATHSFDPGKNAIETLDERFSDYKSSTRPLVIGINIGMLGNFAADGDEVHVDIKTSISQFLAGEIVSKGEHTFINFATYPKFDLSGDEIKAPFIGPLLKRICAADDKNPIYTESLRGNTSSNLHLNYALLCVPKVQQRIGSLLFYAHLKFDQFLTARTVLDFVYQILSGKGSLFDNLFCGKGSELFDSLRMLDPCHARSKTLDLFQVKTSLGLFTPEFKSFKKDIQNQFGLELMEPRSWVRLFYVMQDVELSNNFHHQFRADLKRDLFDEFRDIWQLHRDYDGEGKELRTRLRKFYNETFVSAVTSFANRFAPEIRRDRFLLGKPNGYALSATSTMQPELSKLAEEKPSQLRSFDAYLKVGHDYKVGPVPVSVSFLELARKINQGYRPNTHDKTTVVKLEELVEEVRRIVRKKECLYVQCGDSEWELIDDASEDEIIVERR